MSQPAKAQERPQTLQAPPRARGEELPADLGARKAVLLQEEDAPSPLRQDRGSRRARRTGTDDDDIVGQGQLVRSHRNGKIRRARLTTRAVWAIWSASSGVYAWRTDATPSATEIGD